MEPSLSVELPPLKVTASGAVPLMGVALIAALGAVLVTVGVVTITGVEAWLLKPLLSVTVKVAEYVPALV